MSHTAKVNIEFTTAESKALLRAFAKLGWVDIGPNQARTFNGLTSHPWVIRNPDQSSSGYDIMLTATPGGKILLYTDMYGGSVEKTLGEDLARLKQEFAASVIIEEYGESNVIHSADSNGNLLLEVTLWD